VPTREDLKSVPPAQLADEDKRLELVGKLENHIPRICQARAVPDSAKSDLMECVDNIRNNAAPDFHWSLDLYTRPILRHRQSRIGEPAAQPEDSDESALESEHERDDEMDSERLRRPDMKPGELRLAVYELDADAGAHESNAPIRWSWSIVK